MNPSWKLQDAKARFSELVNCALEGTPQIVTRRGEKAVVVMAYETYADLQLVNKSLKDIFASAPKLTEKDLPISRENTQVIPVNFG